MTTDKTEVMMQRVVVVGGGGLVEVDWGGAACCQYPSVWLRDNCLCSVCFNPSTKSRLIFMKDLDPDVKATAVKCVDNEVRVEWSDGHQSVYPASWLWKRRFTDDARQQRDNFVNKTPILWTAEDLPPEKIPKLSFNELMTSERALYDWLVTLEQYGLFLLTDAPQEVGQLERIAERVAYLKETNYGRIFTVKTKLNPSNLAFTSARLGLHTDLPYYDYSPGMQMLHCIKQVKSEGGDNEFVDGFKVADELRRTRPDVFQLLVDTPIDYCDEGSDAIDFHLIQRRPIIQINEQGEVYHVTWNNPVRDSVLSLPLDKVHAIYKAMSVFHDLLYDKRFLIKTKLTPGDIVCFHNYRVLHGRIGFRTVESGERHLEGGYIDWDELRSTRRVLAAKLQ